MTTIMFNPLPVVDAAPAARGDYLDADEDMESMPLSTGGVTLYHQQLNQTSSSKPRPPPGFEPPLALSRSNHDRRNPEGI